MKRRSGLWLCGCVCVYVFTLSLVCYFAILLCFACSVLSFFLSLCPLTLPRQQVDGVEGLELESMENTRLLSLILSALNDPNHLRFWYTHTHTSNTIHFNFTHIDLGSPPENLSLSLMFSPPPHTQGEWASAIKESAESQEVGYNKFIGHHCGAICA